jgi:hypothetical protein
MHIHEHMMCIHVHVMHIHEHMMCIYRHVMCMHVRYVWVHALIYGYTTNYQCIMVNVWLSLIFIFLVRKKLEKSVHLYGITLIN